MKLLKQIGLAATTFILSINPAFASTQPTTADLLQLMDNSGITVVIDNHHCTGEFDGIYEFTGIARRMIICTGGDGIDTNDHDTVRHETIHALQHCKNSILKRPPTTPLMQPKQVIDHAEDILTPAEIQTIMRMYPEDQWLIELEAFAGAQVLSTAQLMELFNDLCLMKA